MERPKVDVEGLKRYVDTIIEGLPTEKVILELNKEIDGLVMVGSLDSLVVADYMRSLIIYAHFKSKGSSPMNADEYLSYLTDKQLSEEPDWITDSVDEILKAADKIKRKFKPDHAESARLQKIVDTYNDIDTTRRKLIRERADKVVEDMHANGYVSEANFKIRELFIARKYEVVERIAKRSDEKSLTLLASMYKAWDKDLVKAAIFFREAIARNPEYTPAYIGLVEVLIAGKKKDEALKYINNAVNTSDFAKFKPKFDDYRKNAESALNK